MPFYFHSHLVKIFLKVHLNRKGTLSLSVFYQSKKKARKEKGENQIQSKPPHLLWSLSMRLPAGFPSDVAFPSSLWHLCSLSPGPAPSCQLGTGVSAELLKSGTQLFLILVQFKTQSRVLRNQRHFGACTQNWSVLLIIPKQLHRLISVFKRDLNATALQWDTELFPLFYFRLRFLNYWQTILRILLRHDIEAQIFLSIEHHSKPGEQINANWMDFFWFSVMGWQGQGLLHFDTAQMLGCGFNIWQRLATILNQSRF